MIFFLSIFGDLIKVDLLYGNGVNDLIFIEKYFCPQFLIPGVKFQLDCSSVTYNPLETMKNVLLSTFILVIKVDLSQRNTVLLRFRWTNSRWKKSSQNSS